MWRAKTYATGMTEFRIGNDTAIPYSESQRMLARVM
jgi:hypothetical protein